MELAHLVRPVSPAPASRRARAAATARAVGIFFAIGLAMLGVRRALFAENPPRDWASYVIYHSGLVPAGPMRHVVALVERFRRGRKRLVLPPNGA